MFVWFATCESVPEPSGMAALARAVAAIGGLAEGLIHTSATARDPLLDDGAPPPLVLELRFGAIAALEDALVAGGPVERLAAPFHPADHQAMLARRFAVPHPAPRIAAGAALCTYLVAYDGPAADEPGWLGAYLAGHPPLMAQLPGIRALEVCTRLDWVDRLPWPRAARLQRNKVVFDTPAALDAALASPVRRAMRADYLTLPPIAGKIVHYPMHTRIVTPGTAA